VPPLQKNGFVPARGTSRTPRLLNPIYCTSWEKRSGSLDVNLLLRLLRLKLLRKSHCEHALLEARSDLVGVDALWQLEAPFERTEVALLQIIVLLLLLLLFLFFAFDR